MNARARWPHFAASRTWAIALGVCVAVAGSAAWAEADEQRIPASVLDDLTPTPVATATSTPGRAVFVEGNAEQVTRRKLAVPISSPDRRREVARLLLDARADWALTEQLTGKLSARLGVSETHDAGRQRDEQIDLRGAALQWRLGSQGGRENLAEIGRVNLRQGAGLGFNPTDYFKTRTTVDASTRDPQVQRANRLGTAMLNVQHVGEAGSLLVAFAPRLTQSASLIASEPRTRLRLGDTNGEYRLLVKGQLPLSRTVRPELLAFRDRHGWRLGSNLTQAFGQQVTAFVEYSGGKRKPVLRRNLEDGVADGDLPASALVAVPDTDARWLNDLAVGATWTGEHRLSLSAEFELHQGGFTRNDWRRWSAFGSASADGARLAWYLRSAANARLDPLFRRQLFLRMQWDQAGHRDLSVNAFVNHNLDDQSQLGQLALEYRVSQAGRLRALWLFTHGRGTSHYGSDPARHALVIGYVYYL